MELTGGVYKIEEERQVTENFKKKAFILFVENEKNPDFPDYLNIECTQGKCSLLDEIEVNDMVRVSVNLQGKKWVNPEGKEVFFNSLRAWNIVKINSEDNGSDDAIF